MSFCSHVLMHGARKGLTCGMNTNGDLSGKCHRHRKLKGDGTKPASCNTKGKKKVIKEEVDKALNDPEYPLQPIETVQPQKPFFKKISNMTKKIN